jgi:hypothetical protein
MIRTIHCPKLNTVVDTGRFAIHPEGDERVEVSGAELRVANKDDEFICAWIDAASVGDSFVFGGGAAPTFLIERVA